MRCSTADTATPPAAFELVVGTTRAWDTLRQRAGNRPAREAVTEAAHRVLSGRPIRSPSGLARCLSLCFADRCATPGCSRHGQDAMTFFRLRRGDDPLPPPPTRPPRKGQLTLDERNEIR